MLTKTSQFHKQVGLFQQTIAKTNQNLGPVCNVKLQLKIGSEHF